MNVLHLNTHDTGGAAVALINLHKALLEKGIDSHCLFLKKSGSIIQNSNYFSNKKSKSSIILDKVKGKFGISYEKKIQKKLSDKPKGYEGYSFPITPYKVHMDELVKNADIINLHFISRFIDYPSFFPAINKPLVWTLHDMNPFLGGFHYYNDCVAFNTQFGELENELLTIKKKALSEINNLNIVTPSSYLMVKSLSSDILNRFPHHLIRYSVDKYDFQIYDKRFCRDVFNLPQDKPLFLFVSEDVNNKRKGFDILLNAIEDFDRNEIAFCTVGKRKEEKQINEIVTQLGVIRDPKLLALAYSAADAFILPSREDNLPNTMLESLSCGTPVLTFSNGGMKDVIQTGINGIITDEISSQSLKKIIKDFLSGKYIFNKQKIRNSFEKNFSHDVQAKKYINLYNSILNNHQIAIND